MNSVIIKKSLKDKKNYISIVIITLSILLITVAFSFYKMCSNYYKETSKTLQYRTLYIHGHENGWSVYNKKNDRIKDINHIADYYYNNETREGFGLEKIGDSKYTGDILIRGIGDNVNINVVEGKRDISNDEIICPTILSADIMENLAKDKSLIIKYNVGDLVVGHIDQYDTNLKKVNAQKINFKIVGKYLEHNTDAGFNVCYGTHNAVTNLYEIRTQYEKDFTSDNSAISVIVDSQKNIDSVINEITKLGYDVEREIVFNMSVVTFLYMIVVIVVLVVSSATAIVVIAIYNKNKEYYISEGLMYKTFGYSTNEAVNIYTKQLLFIEMCGAIFSLLILIIVEFVLKSLLNGNPYVFYGMNVSVSFAGYLFALLVNVIIILILRKRFASFLEKASISMELKKND